MEGGRRVSDPWLLLGILFMRKGEVFVGRDVGGVKNNGGGEEIKSKRRIDL